MARYFSGHGQAVYSRITGAAFADVTTAFTWLAVVSVHLYRHTTEAGVLLDTAGLLPSAAGARVALAGGKVTVTDGPFTESKELISYALYDVRSKEEAVEWASRFVKLHRDLWPGWEGQNEIRQVMGPQDVG